MSSRPTTQRGSIIDGTGVADRIGKLSDSLIDFIIRFCAIESVNPPGRNYLNACEFLAAKLKSLGLATRIVRVPAAEQARIVPGMDDCPRYCVVARWDVGAPRTLHLTGHYDVVPATNGWKSDPFKAFVRGGKLIGRGTADMKGSDSAAIFAVQALRQAGVTPPWNVELSFTPDEETGGAAGLGWLVRSGTIAPDAAILCEGASGDKVGYAHRGVLWADVTVLGKSGHACNPKNGINALEKAMPLIARFKTLERVYAGRRTRFNIRQRHPTLMIGSVSGGGGKVNTIPDRFHFTIDRRLNPEDKVADVKRELIEQVRLACRRDPQLKVKVDWPLYVPPGWIEPDAPMARLALSALKSLRRGPVRFSMTAGFTDMHFLTADGGVPTVMYGVEGAGAHSDFEYVKLPELIAAVRFYAEMMLRVGAG
ncbi:MAG: ArgE/DapE family deacylase [Phycisphaerae bacterium]|nr:ArgE/DapE family deacylase [Phycisphaerae bacterium]